MLITMAININTDELTPFDCEIIKIQITNRKKNEKKFNQALQKLPSNTVLRISLVQYSVLFGTPGA